MSKFVMQTFYAAVICLILFLQMQDALAAPRSPAGQRSIVDAGRAARSAVEAEDLDTGAAEADEKDDLQGSASYGYGYYAYPYYDGFYGGYYPYYSSYYGGFGYPYYLGGYYGGYGHYHGHFY